MEDTLIQRAQAGDDRAFDQLIEQHRQVIFRYAYLIVDDAQVAEDVTQEAVLRIYKNLKRFNHDYAFRPWALQITRNQARNQKRAWGRYKHMLRRLITGHERDSASVEAVTDAQREAQALHEAVRQLKADHQDVIYTRFFMELSVEECANVLSIPEGTVKSRSYRALKQLKALIEQQYPQLKREVNYER